MVPLLKLCAVTSALFALLAMPALADPPPNDDLANAQTVTLGTTPASNVEATEEAAEDLRAQFTYFGKTVWFAFTPPADGVYRIDTGCAGTVDTVLTVYTGNDYADPLERVGTDDDGCGRPGSGVPSAVSLKLDHAKTYKIQVGGWRPYYEDTIISRRDPSSSASRSSCRRPTTTSPTPSP